MVSHLNGKANGNVSLAKLVRGCRDGEQVGDQVKEMMMMMNMSCLKNVGACRQLALMTHHTPASHIGKRLNGWWLCIHIVNGNNHNNNNDDDGDNENEKWEKLVDLLPLLVLC